MRIISGKFKFYNIELEKKESFTPTSSFLRENIFNILPALINFNKLMVADVFAGSGSLGLEALSRDVKFAYFNDFDAKNIKRIQKHCEKLQIQNCEISQLHFLQFFLKLQQQKSQLDLVFIDPPFDRPDLINKSMELLLTGNLLNENAVLVVISPQLINFADVNLKLCKLKKYAKKFIYFFQKKKNALNMPTR
ncbi:MAG: RsmD family RNA methyltransferase [Mollicutes bacterium]|nr:MAG: RsmD family RNA methyltransferase [Mollicutes bacterium]